MAFQQVAGAEQWASLCSTTFVPLSVRSVDPRFTAALDHLPLTESVGITQVRCTASEVFRSDKQIRRDPSDSFLIAVQNGGEGWVEQNGRRVRMAEGQASIYDTETPYALRFDALMSETVLQVPRRLLDPRRSQSPNITARVLSEHNPALAALRSLMRASVARPDAPGPSEPKRPGQTAIVIDGELLADAAVNLVRTAIAVESGGWHAPPAETNHLALQARVAQFVDAHLSDPHLTPDVVAIAHHVSLRQLQMVLAGTGHTPAGMIRDKRLAYARQQLVSGGSVSDIAFRAGFSEIGTFTRAFKRSTGETPSAFRDRHLAVAPAA